LTKFQLDLVKKITRNGGIIAYPTEAVYGLGCDPLNPEAVNRLLRIKQRSMRKGLIIIASKIEQILPYVALKDKWIKHIEKSWPGSQTWLIPVAENVPIWINGGKSLIACRVTAHPVANSICEHLGSAIISTSANKSKQRPAKTALQVRMRCPEVDFIVSGELGDLKKPTPIYDITTGIKIR
tara:strand:- start:536 stop:1081 length:546 start_codon:yes stop_codon:yes gene_type:complete